MIFISKLMMIILVPKVLLFKNVFQHSFHTNVVH